MLRRAAQCLAKGLSSPCPTHAAQEVAGTVSTSCSTTGNSWLALPTGWAQLLIQRSKYTYKFKKAANSPGLIFWKPTTPGQRHKITVDYKSLGVYTGAPHPDLSVRVANTGGRDGTGRISAWHRGGGQKKVLRTVDYTRSELDGIPGVVQRIELDPNRTGFLALVKYHPEGELPILRYHIAPADVKVGDIMHSGSQSPIVPGSSMSLQDVPLGVPIHNIELKPGRGGVLARAANTHATVLSKAEVYATVRLPSGELRLVDLKCKATIGTVSNPYERMTNLGKAGEKRKRGIRPTTRGYAMNPVDHPHGGRTNGGRPSCTPWGVYCKGQRTRPRNSFTNKFILKRKGGQPMHAFVQAKKWRAKAEAEAKAKTGGGGKAPKKVASPPAQPGAPPALPLPLGRRIALERSG